MRTIALFGLCGGAGRTTIAKALIDGFQERGDSVLLITFDDAANRSELVAWVGGRSLSPAPAFLVPSSVADFDRALGFAHERGVDAVVIDLPANLSDRVLRACESADLVLCPVSGIIEAGRVADSVFENLSYRTPVMGVLARSNPYYSTTEIAAIKARFGWLPFLRSDLRHNELCRRLSLPGSAYSILRELYSSRMEGTLIPADWLKAEIASLTEPDVARFAQDLRALGEDCESLCREVLEVLDAVGDPEMAARRIIDEAGGLPDAWEGVSSYAR